MNIPQQVAITTATNKNAIPNVKIKSSLSRYEQNPSQTKSVVADTFQHDFSVNMYSVNNESRVIAAANKKRRYMLIQNVGANDAWINFGGTAINAARGILLPAGTSLEFNNAVPNNEVQAVCLPTTRLSVCEANVLL